MGLRICIRLSLNNDWVIGPPEQRSMVTNYYRDLFEANGLRKRGTATYENPADNLTPANVQAILAALALLGDLPHSMVGAVTPVPPDVGLDHLWSYIAPWPEFEATRLVQPV